MSSPIAAMLLDPDRSALARRLAPGVQFLSPAADYDGREDVTHLVAQIAAVLERVTVTRELHDGERTTTFLDASVAGQSLLGVLDEHRDADGRVDRAVLWLRPLPVLRVAIDRMRERLAIDPLPSLRP